jgi:hypothetical protein
VEVEFDRDGIVSRQVGIGYNPTTPNTGILLAGSVDVILLFFIEIYFE